MGKNGRFCGHFLGAFRWQVIGFGPIWRAFLTKKDSNFANFLGKLRLLAYAMTDTPFCLCKTGDLLLQENLDYLPCLYLLTRGYFNSDHHLLF